jgi:hypothetical protein
MLQLSDLLAGDTICAVSMTQRNVGLTATSILRGRMTVEELYSRYFISDAGSEEQKRNPSRRAVLDESR